MKIRKIFISVIFALIAIVTFSYATGHTSADTQNATHQEKESVEKKEYQPKSLTELAISFWRTTGINAIFDTDDGEVAIEPDGTVKPIGAFESSIGRIIMIIIVFILFYLAIAKGFEPLLLIPIAFGGLLANIPLAHMTGPHGMLGVIYNMGIANEFFPLLIFMGVGAMTDFGPLLANPKTALLGGAAQFGIFGSLVGAVMLGFDLQSASAISIIGQMDLHLSLLQID